MALGDNVIFAHFCDTLDSDEPAITPTDAGGGDPTVSGGKHTYASAASGDGQIYSGGNTFNPGTDGDWSIAVRFKITTENYLSNAIIHVGTSTTFQNHIVLYDAGSRLIASYSYDTNQYILSNTSTIDYTNTFVAVLRHDSSEAKYLQLFIDGTDESSTRVGDFDAPTGSESMTLNSSSQVVLGSEADGSRPADVEIEWAVVWDRAVTNSEITNNMNETDLKAAILGGAVGPLAGRHLQNLMSN